MNPRSGQLSQLLDAALELPIGERAELAALLLDSVGDGASEAEVRSEWILEAKRRLAAVERGESTPVPFTEMMARLRDKAAARRG